MNAATTSFVHLSFDLRPVDDWPPFAVEGIPCVKGADGYRVTTAPLFVIIQAS